MSRRRYRLLVPRDHQALVRRWRIFKPLWFVGAAEQPPIPRDPALVKEIDEIKEELRQKAQPRVVSQPVAEEEQAVGSTR